MQEDTVGNSIVKAFDFKGTAVRTVAKGEVIWWVARDVCAALSLDPTQTRRLDEDEKDLCSIQTPGGSQEFQVVSESGLYALVLGSRKPEAKTFRKWVTSEVLPSIRKTGGYVALGHEQAFVDSLNEQLQQTRAMLNRSLDLQDRLVDTMSRMYSPNGLVRKDQAAMIRGGITALARMSNRDRSVSDIVAYRRVDKHIRCTMQPSFGYGRWTTLPITRFGDAMSAISFFHAELEALARSEAKHFAKMSSQNQQVIDFESFRRRF